MRKAYSYLFIGILAVSAVLLFEACHRDKVRTITYTIYHNVTVQKSALLSGINGNASESVSKPGQLYVQGSLLLLNDVDKGIHVYDNSNPAHPTQIAFLNIPGNRSIAMRGNTLFADVYCGLVAIDLSNPTQPKLLSVNWEVFSQRGYSSDTSTVVTGMISKDTTITVPVSPGPTPPGGPVYMDLYAASAAGTSGGAGIGGSEAAMTLIGNYLYAIPQPHAIGVINISDPTRLKLDTIVGGGYDLETIFPMQDKLLCGSMEGVYIYSLADPSFPKEIRVFTHGRACDPVIADKSYAYVTLHSGTSCGGSSNELDVLSAQDLMNSTLVKTYPMNGPLGLGKDGNLLFICDGPGVKVFDAADPTNLHLKGILPIDGAYDVIAANHLLIVGGAKGLYEFDDSDPDHIKPLGSVTMK